MPGKKSGRLKLPRDTMRAMQRAKGERRLAWALDSEGEWYVGTDRALHLRPGHEAYRVLGWEQIERADWSQDVQVLGVVEVAEWGDPETRIDITVADPGDLLGLLRERVTSSVVVSRYAAVRGRRGLSVVGRRSPVGQGPVVWSFVLAEGLHPDDQDVREVASRALQAAEAELAGL